MDEMLLKIYEKLLEISENSSAINSKEMWECDVRRKIVTIKNVMWPNDKSMKSTYAYIFEYVKQTFGFNSIDDIVSEYKIKYPDKQAYTMNAMLDSSKGLFMLDVTLDRIIKEGEDVFNISR